MNEAEKEGQTLEVPADENRISLAGDIHPPEPMGSMAPPTLSTGININTAKANTAPAQQMVAQAQVQSQNTQSAANNPKKGCSGLIWGFVIIILILGAMLTFFWWKGWLGGGKATP